MSRARELSRLGNPNIISADSSFNVGFGTLTPKEKVNVVGVVSATSFFGDGSTLDGIASAGIGTALSDDKTKALNTIYYTNDEVLVNTTSTVNPPDSGHIAYTQAPTVVIEDTVELTVSDGDDLLVDVLGISTGTNVDYAARGNGVFGNIYVDNIESSGGQTSVNFPKGLVSTGVATFHSDVSIGGTLTYEDVKNIDSVGLITARTGIKVTAGGVDIDGGGIDIVGDIGLGAGAQTGTSGQLLTSGGAGANATWSDPPSSGTTITGICSGTMPANRAVCVHSDGKVGVVTGTASLFGNAVEVDAAYGFGTQGQEVAYGNGVVVVHYANQQNYSFVRAGTIDGTTITWGTAVQVTTGEQGALGIVYNAVASNFIVTYRRSNGGRLKLVTVSGTTCTLGSEVDYETSNGYIENVAMSYDSTAQKAVIVYKEGNTNQGHARVITADSSSISLGTKNSNIFGATCDQLWLYYDSVTDKTYVTGHDGGASSMSFMIGTISGTDITFANKSQPLGNMYGAYKSVMVRDTQRNKLVLVGRGSGSTNNLYYTIGTWGGSNFTWTARVVAFSEDPMDYRITYNPYADKIVMAGENETTMKASYWTGAMAKSYEDDLNTIHWSTPKVISSTSSGEWISMADIPDGVVMTYASNTTDTNNNLHYSIEQYQNSTLNDDGDNFIGYSADAYTNGQTATINVVGNVALGQVGLTTGSDYYIQGDGGLLIYYFSNKNTVTNVKAGTAITHDQLLIRGLT